jgi:micrococcal nuclease
MFNRTLVKEGYAQMATFPPNVKYVEEFRALQKEARDGNRGLWGLKDSPVQPTMDNTADGRATSGVGAPPATWQPTNRQCVTGGKEYIKGNISSSGKVYHAPGQRNYAQTDPEACFATGKDAEAAGYRASKV